MSKKAPGFMFYPQDYLSEWRLCKFNLAQHGAYNLLLFRDWANDGIPGDLDEIRFLLPEALDENLLNQVLDLFIDHPEKEGMITSPRLLEQRRDYKIYREKQSTAGRRSAEARLKENRTRKQEEEAKKPKPESQQKQISESQSPILEGCEFFRATQEELAKARETWVKTNTPDTFELAINEVDFWLGSETPGAKKARKAGKHTRQLFAAWVQENLNKRKSKLYRGKQVDGQGLPLNKAEIETLKLKERLSRARAEDAENNIIEVENE